MYAGNQPPKYDDTHVTVILGRDGDGNKVGQGFKGPDAPENAHQLRLIAEMLQPIDRQRQQPTE
jgi:hypothetical protein